MEPLISIVIPVYNVEKYIDRCIVSVVEQTYKNLEIILVDDGTPDDSGKLCDEWAEKDDRIVVYHKPNGGLSDARNYGTERANGEFITYIDSDDYVLPEYVEYLYNNLVACNADISCCDLKSVYKNERVTSFEDNICLNSVEKTQGNVACYDAIAYKSGFYYVVACGKLYKKEILNKYQYPVGRYHEDEATTYKYLYESEYVAKGDKKLYAYFQNTSSITHNRNDKNQIDTIYALKERTEFFKEKQDRKMEIASWDALMSNYIYCNIENPKRFTKEVYTFARQHWFNGDLTPKAKFKFLLYALSPRLYKKIINILFE